MYLSFKYILFICSMIASDPIDKEDGDYKTKEDREHRTVSEQDKNRVTWNTERRCFLETTACKSWVVSSTLSNHFSSLRLSVITALWLVWSGSLQGRKLPGQTLPVKRELFYFLHLSLMKFCLKCFYGTLMERNKDHRHQ